MGGLLVIVLLVPLLVWGLFMPVPAAILHLCLVGFFEMILLSAAKLLPLNYKLSNAAVIDPELLVRRHYWYLRNPEAAVGLSRMCSAVSLLSVPWVCLLVWQRHWILAVLMVGNCFVASSLAMRLNPIDYLERAARRDPAAGVAALLLKTVRNGMEPDEDNSLIDDLLASNPEFQALVAKSKTNPRKPFQPWRDGD